MNPPAVQRFLDDLASLGYCPVLKQVTGGGYYAILSNYMIEHGKYQGRMIDLGLPALTDYPRQLGPSMHVTGDSQLVSLLPVPGRLNVVESPLGAEWRYWSYRFTAHPNETALQLMNQVNTIFKDLP